MKPPVEHVKISNKGRDILLKIKRRTGLEHWNEICRLALCKSLANNTPPPKVEKFGETAIDIDWKVFAGSYSDVFAALVVIKAKNDGIEISNGEEVSSYFRFHMERGIFLIKDTAELASLISI